MASGRENDMRRIVLGLVLVCLGMCAAADTAWRGVHVMAWGTAGGSQGLPMLKRAIDEVMRPAGVNVLVYEVGYNFAFDSHPEMRFDQTISKEEARDLARFCKERGIRLIPQFNCLGHQSWARRNMIFPLMSVHPEFEEVPDVPEEKRAAILKNWCPLHPDVYPIVFDLIDEIADAFEADAFHVGMDEVLTFASPKCPRCAGKAPADLFAHAVNELHRHIVDERGWTMLMWGDRLLDAAIPGMGEGWAASNKNTAPAIDMIPKDIIMCDWHYNAQETYPSIELLVEKGFRVWPASWTDPNAGLRQIAYAKNDTTGRILGHLSTSWVIEPGHFAQALLGEGDQEALNERALPAAKAFKTCIAAMAETVQPTPQTLALEVAPVLVPPDAAHRFRAFQGIPGIERAANGRLWATWYGGGTDEGPENYVMLATSADDGATWSDIVLAIDPPGVVRAFDPCLWHDPQGRLWLFWAQGVTLWDGRAGVWAMVTDDSTAESPVWSAPRRICDGVMMNKPTVLRDGTWLLPAAVWAMPSIKPAGPEYLIDIAATTGSWVVASTDNGATFVPRGRSDVKGRQSDEHMLVERRDGSLWMLVRTNYGIGESVSTDAGVSWSEGVPSKTVTHIDSAARFFIRRLASGRLLLVKHAPPSNHGRSHLTAYLSEDDGVTWQGGLLLDERAGVSYPDGLQAPDGTIYIIYDYSRYEAKEILMATFTEEDVAAGKCVSDKARLRVLVNKAAESAPVTAMVGDSLALVKTEPGRLCCGNLVEGTVVARSTYEPDQPDTVVYEEGRDYAVDYAAGTIARTADSRMPDFSTNMLYGQKEFDHNQFPGFGNRGFQVFVDYETRDTLALCEPRDQAALLPKTVEKLRAGGPFKIIAYGDSITVGIDASSPRVQFQERWVRHLTERFPQAQITLENGATNGDSSGQGLVRLREKVLDRAPDLVIIGFGMNDHNINGPSPEQFAENLKSIATQIRDNTGAEVLLYSAFPPNPDWKFGSHRMELFAEATRRAAEQLNCAYADVFGVWQKVLARKDLCSLLGNNINHPNDFGHWLYFQALKCVVF